MCILEQRPVITIHDIESTLQAYNNRILHVSSMKPEFNLALMEKMIPKCVQMVVVIAAISIHGTFGKLRNSLCLQFMSIIYANA